MQKKIKRSKRWTRNRRDFISRRLVALACSQPQRDEVFARLEKATVDQNAEWKQVQGKLSELKAVVLQPVTKK